MFWGSKLVLHNGLRENLTQLRSKYWFAKAQNFIKKVLRNCIICRKREGEPNNYPSEPPLPRESVACERAFSNCSFD